MGFWLYGLFDLDEGYYAAVVAEMNRRGEWITPYFNGHPWFEKPVLLYWFAKPSISLFGEALGPRLPSILATIGLFLVCGLYLRKRVSGVSGRWAVAILGTSLLVIVMGRMMTTDALLDLCVCGAFLSFYESLIGARGWRVLTAFCLGLAVLAKGPVSLPLFIAVAIWTYIAEPELRPAFKGYWLLGTVVLFATVSAWYWPAYSENGKVFVQKFFVEQNLQRFGGGDEAHKVPLLLWPIYYPAILILGMAPWSIGTVKPWVDALRKKGGSLDRFLARWALVVLLFFSISGTKLPHYILPAVPALAMILALWLARTRGPSWKYVGSLSVAYCLLANIGSIWWYRRGGFAEIHSDAREVNQMVGAGNGLVVAYELGRIANATGTLGLNQTDSPSLAFYLDEAHTRLADSASYKDLESWLQTSHGPCFVLTRPGRLSQDQLRRLSGEGLLLEQVSAQDGGENYVLYRVQSSPALARPSSALETN